MEKYSYEGPVYEFGRCIASHWTATTWAVSEEKAMCNFKYQYKKNHYLPMNTKIDLPGEITLE